MYTPMKSGDGLLVRVRAGARPLSSADLRALAELARRHGNGLLELTRRANVQLRGVRELPALQAGLVAAGLAEADPLREQRLAPLLVDPSLSASAFEAALAASGYRPSAKLAIVVEGGARVAVDADVRVRLDGALAYLSLGPAWLGSCARAEAPGHVLALLALLSEHGVLRARELPRSVLDELASSHLHGALTSAVPTDAPHAQPQQVAARVALPFGAGDAAQFAGLAGLVESVRVTPERELLLAGQPDLQAVSALGLIVDADDPLRRVVACPGAPACSSALGDTRGLARALAPLGLAVHVSGCEKGCASSAVSAATLVRTAHGARLAFDCDVGQAALAPELGLEEARRQLAVRAAATRVRPPMSREYDYVRDGAEIYRRSFAIIRAEARLGRFGPIEERVAVRLIHTSGMVDLADDIVFSPGFAEAASGALRRGAPVLCDANMIVSGVTRARLAASNELLCFLDQPGLGELAKQQQTTRSAAALAYWKPRLDGALVAIGNAPTALFRLLELLDEVDVRPAAVIGLPVGFVGAAESKAALLEDGRVPAMIVRGRRGGSAMTVAAINALASDQE